MEVIHIQLNSTRTMDQQDHHISRGVAEPKSMKEKSTNLTHFGKTNRFEDWIKQKARKNKSNRNKEQLRNTQTLTKTKVLSPNLANQKYIFPLSLPLLLLTQLIWYMLNHCSTKKKFLLMIFYALNLGPIPQLVLQKPKQFENLFSRCGYMKTMCRRDPKTNIVSWRSVTSWGLLKYLHV